MNQSNESNGADAFKQLLEQRRAQLQNVGSSLSSGAIPEPPKPPKLPSSVQSLQTGLQTGLQTQYSSIQYQQFLQQLPKLPPQPPPPFSGQPPLHYLPNTLPPSFPYQSQPGAQYYLPTAPYSYYPQLPGYQVASRGYVPPPPQNVELLHQTIPSHSNNYQPAKSPYQKQKNHSKTNPPSSSSSIKHPLPAVTEPEQEYFCEPCDKSFKKSIDYQAHCKTHEKCSHPECSFFASKKVVTAHYLSRHGEYAGNGYKLVEVEGQRFNLLLGYSPEEIDEWKKERRKKFPTKERVQEKQEHVDSLQQAGGIIPSNNKQNRNKKNKNKSVSFNHGESNVVGSKRTLDSNSQNGSHNGEKSKKRQKLNVPPPLEGGSRGSLLKKLLSDEIVHEENLLLQCIHYVCEQNFFMEHSHSSLPDTNTQYCAKVESDESNEDDNDFGNSEERECETN